MLQVRNPRVTKSWSGGTSQSLLGSLCCQGQRQEQHPHTSSLLPSWEMALGKLHRAFQRSFAEKGERFTHSAPPPAMLRASSCSVKAAGRHWPPPAPLCCPRVTSCPSALHQTPSPSSAGASCPSQHSPDPQPAIISLSWTGFTVGCAALDQTSNMLRKQGSSLRTSLSEIWLRICIILGFWPVFNLWSIFTPGHFSVN